MTTREKETTEDQQTGHTDVVGDVVLGKVASPSGSEATSDEFVFWADDSLPVEKTQIVRVQSLYGDRSITFRGVIDEVYRRSRRRDVLEEADRFGLDPQASLPLDSQGVTYARAKILASCPNMLMPPREESAVFLADPRDAAEAYGFNNMGAPLVVGLLKNGGAKFAGPAMIDLDYLLGANGAHMNVTGIAGAGAKSSFLLSVLKQLLHHCDSISRSRPSGNDKLSIVPIILNVKGYDLLWLDRENARYRPDTENHVWAQMGVEKPAPFAGARFVAPGQPRTGAAIPVGRAVDYYSWSLADVVADGVFPFLFGDEDREDENFLALLQDVEAHITYEAEVDQPAARCLAQGAPETFDGLLGWVAQQAAARDEDRVLRSHHQGTWRKFHRRLRRIVTEGEGVLNRYGQRGQPLRVTATGTSPPLVVDIQGIQDAALQRFVVATIFKQVSEARLGTNAIANLAYVLVIDELNRWAPRGAKDAITRLIERVVAEMRSQGVILLGAQQQASQVSPRVIENSAIRVLGRTGSLELSHDLWGFLDRSAKRAVENLPINEKLIYEVDFRRPMHVRAPQPAWAMRRDEAVSPRQATGFSEREAFER